MNKLLSNAPTTAYSNTLNCLVCGELLDLRQTRGRSSRKPSLMFVCPADGRHFRAFITYRPYVDGILERLAAGTSAEDADDDSSEATTRK